MYLQEFRAAGYSINKWPVRSDIDELKAAYDVADATLNSWKEAHDAFARYQPTTMNRHVTVDALGGFCFLVRKALRQTYGPGPSQHVCNVYPVELISYILLTVWIDQAIADEPDLPITPGDDVVHWKLTQADLRRINKSTGDYNDRAACATGNAHATLRRTGITCARCLQLIRKRAV